MLGLVNRPDDISLSRANQSQVKCKSAVGRNLLQSWVNLTIVIVIIFATSIALIVITTAITTTRYWYFYEHQSLFVIYNRGEVI